MKKNPFTFVKLLIIVLAVVMLITTFVSTYIQLSVPADNQPAETTAPEDDALKMFAMERIGYGGGVTYFRDTISDVMYVRSGYGNEAGLAVMLDPETGLPLTYTRYMELYDNLQATNP